MMKTMALCAKRMWWKFFQSPSHLSSQGWYTPPRLKPMAMAKLPMKERLSTDTYSSAGKKKRKKRW